MTTLTKTLLSLAVGGLVLGLLFTTGFIDAREMVVLYVASPAGAIFLGLFMLSKILEKETALYDREHAGAPEAKTAEGPHATSLREGQAAGI